MNAVAMQDEPEPRRTALATTTPADLVRIAVEQNADLEKISKLMDLQDRWEAKQARNAFVAAMSAFKGVPIEILKRKRVHFEARNGGAKTDYKHAELADVCDAVVPALAQHGLSHRWDVRQEDTKVIVTCILTHVDGHSESLTLGAAIDTSGNKNHIQAIGSAATYLSRYTLLLITGLATKSETPDDDGRGAGDHGEPPKMTEEHAATIESLCASISSKMLANVLASYTDKQGRHPPSVGELPDSEYASIVERLNMRAKKGAES